MQKQSQFWSSSIMAFVINYMLDRAWFGWNIDHHHAQLPTPAMETIFPILGHRAEFPQILVHVVVQSEYKKKLGQSHITLSPRMSPKGDPLADRGDITTHFF